MVVHVIYVKGVWVVKAEDNPPVCTNGYSPKPLVLALELMQPETGHVHIGHHAGGVEPCENIAELSGVFGKDAPWVVDFIKAFQTLVADRPKSFLTVTRNVTHVKR